MGDKKTLTRHKVRRKLEACATHCDQIQQHLADAAQPFEDAKHKAHAGFLRLGEVTEMLKELITSFRATI